MEVRYGPGEQFADDVSDEDLEAAAAFVDGLIAKRRVARSEEHSLNSSHLKLSRMPSSA